MNLREKLGQRFIYRLPGVTHLTKEVADFLTECHAGGVVLFGYNIQTPEQVAELNRDLQALATKKGLPPFIISVDEEGGQTSRMPAKGQDLIIPSQMALAVAGAEALRACVDVNARRLRQLGFNLNYAPVLDINKNPVNPVIGTRSFGEDPHKVAELGAIAIETYLKANISPCVKHFPGHGDTSIDSHFQMPVVQKTLEQLHNFELVPFKRAITAGIPAIMSAHILYPLVEISGLPATLSPRFLTQLLRHELGFDGLVFTDALDMQAVSHYSLGRRCVLALQAGADVVMSFSMSFDEQRAAFEEVVAAAERGEFDTALLNNTLARLEKWRNRFCIPPGEALPSQKDSATVTQAARQSLTINSKPDFLPLANEYKRPLLIDFTAEPESPVETGRLPGPLLEQELQARLPNLLRLEVPVEPVEADADKVCAVALQSDLLLIVTRNAMRFAGQKELVQLLLRSFARSVPIVAIAARDPYDMAFFEEATTSIAIYGDPPVMIKALAQRLTVVD